MEVLDPIAPATKHAFSTILYEKMDVTFEKLWHIVYFYLKELYLMNGIYIQKNAP